MEIRDVRIYLAGQRARNVPFDEAWKTALEKYPPHPWYWGQGNGCTQDGHRDSPIVMARRWFERAYYGYDLPGPHYTELEAALIELARERVSLPPPDMNRAKQRAHKNCRWGGPVCREPTVNGRFCTKHLEFLERFGHEHGLRAPQEVKVAA